MGELLWFLAEFVLELVFELTSDAIWRPFGEPRPGGRGVLALIALTVVGALCGWGSVSIVRDAFIQDPGLRWANLVVTPVLAGGVMALLGNRRRRREQPTTPLDRFGTGALFALAFVAARLAALTVTAG